MKHRGQHDDDCFGCRVKSIQFGSVPGGYARTRVLKAHEAPKGNGEDSYGKAPAKHNGVPLLHASDLSPVTLRETAHNQSSVKKRLAAVKAAGTIKE